ncbi:MAG: hypothetical protein ACR2PU_00310 [Gammaproteobacteria bacterium]
MNKLLPFILTLFVVPCLTSCDTSSDNETLDTMCSEPRPEVCTMEHDPVCGYKSDGTSKTYSNGCSACTEIEIIGYKNGECP